jgi:hypothetical protein
VPLVRFLIAHPTIEDLAIGYHIYSEWTTELDESALIPGMLPRLKSFNGNAKNLAKLARRGVHSLKSLVNLTTGYGPDRWTHPEQVIDGMLEALENFGGLPSLKALCFEPGDAAYGGLETMKRWLASISNICPALKKLSGYQHPRSTVRSIIFAISITSVQFDGYLEFRSN